MWPQQLSQQYTLQTPGNAPCCFATLSGHHWEPKTPEIQHAESLPTMHHRPAQHAWASGCQTPINYSSALHPVFLLSSMVLASSCILKAEARERSVKHRKHCQNITTLFKKNPDSYFKPSEGDGLKSSSQTACLRVSSINKACAAMSNFLKSWRTTIYANTFEVCTLSGMFKYAKRHASVAYLHMQMLEV